MMPKPFMNTNPPYGNTSNAYSTPTNTANQMLSNHHHLYSSSPHSNMLAQQQQQQQAPSQQHHHMTSPPQSHLYHRSTSGSQPTTPESSATLHRTQIKSPPGSIEQQNSMNGSSRRANMIYSPSGESNSYENKRSPIYQQQQQQQQANNAQPFFDPNNNLFNKSNGSANTNSNSNSGSSGSGANQGGANYGLNPMSNMTGVISNLINTAIATSAAAAAAGPSAGGKSGLGLDNQTAAIAAASANLILANLSSVAAAAAASNNAAQSQGKGGNQYAADESKCHVCGDKSTGSHFGGISCESCKAFFRRSVQKNRFEDYKCSYSGECKMNTNTRKICQFCRYKSCLAIGMKPKWVLSDDERHQKYGNRRKNKNKPDEANVANSQQQQQLPGNNLTSPSSSMSNTGPTMSDPVKKAPINDESSNPAGTSAGNGDQSSSNNQTNASNSDDESLGTPPTGGGGAVGNSTNNNNNNHTGSGHSSHTPADIKRLGVDGIDTTPSRRYLQLNAYEKDLIDRLSIAFYHSRKYNALDLNIQKKLGMLFQTANPSSLKKMSKVILANFIVQPVKRVITFAKLIPDFLKLDLHDQMSLLQGGSMEIFICSSFTLYDQMSNKFNNIISKDRNIQGNDSSNIQLDILRLIWSEDVFEKTISYLKSMSDLKIDEATLILYLPLILFSPDRRNLQNRSKILDIQSKYSLLLKKYMLWKYGHKQETLRLFDKLLLKLIELRTLHEMHSSILLDADPSQLEPFPLALILSEKEEATMIKTEPPATTAGPSTSSAAGDNPPSTSSQQQQEHRRDSVSTDMATNSEHNSGTNLNAMTPSESNSSSSGLTSSIPSVESPFINNNAITAMNISGNDQLDDEATLQHEEGIEDEANSQDRSTIDQ